MLETSTVNFQQYPPLEFLCHIPQVNKHQQRTAGSGPSQRLAVKLQEEFWAVTVTLGRAALVSRSD